MRARLSRAPRRIICWPVGCYGAIVDPRRTRSGFSWPAGAHQSKSRAILLCGAHSGERGVPEPSMDRDTHCPRLETDGKREPRMLKAAVRVNMTCASGLSGALNGVICRCKSCSALLS